MRSLVRGRSGMTLTISVIGGNWCAGEYARNVASEVA